MRNLRSVFAYSVILPLFAVAPFSADAQTTERVSVDSDGNPGNDGSYNPSISADGRLVAFESLATNLVAGDTNGFRDIFVHDRETGATERVSVDSAGAQAGGHSYDPVISADGRYVAFASDAEDLVPDDSNGYRDIFVHDRVSGSTQLVSVDSSGVHGNWDSFEPAISADGRYVAFSSLASNFFAGDNNFFPDVFRHDRTTGLTERISVDDPAIKFYTGGDSPAVSADGSQFAYVARSYVDYDSAAYSHDRDIGLTDSMPIDFFPLIPGDIDETFIWRPSISADGRFVALRAFAFVRDPDFEDRGILTVFDREQGLDLRILQEEDFLQGPPAGAGPRISADGRYVAFWSVSTDLVTGDTNDSRDVFVHDRNTGITQRVSISSAGTQGNSDSDRPDISADGGFVAFDSLANNLVPDDTNSVSDVFVKERGPTVGDLIALVDSFDLAKGVDRVLRRMLENIGYALESGDTDRSQVAANKLEAFIGYVDSQRGRSLTDEQADQLIAMAGEILEGVQSSGTG